MKLNSTTITPFLFLLIGLAVAQSGIEVMPGVRTGEGDSSQQNIDMSLERFRSGAEIERMTIEQVIELAIQNNRSLKIFRLSQESAMINLEQAEYRFLPSAYVQAARNESRNDDLGYVIKKNSL